MLTRKLFTAGLLGVWVVSMSWLVRYEAFPHWFEDTIQGYRTLTREMPAVRDTWMKILADGTHVGYANSTLELEEDGDGRDVLHMRSQMVMRVRMAGSTDELRMNTGTRVRGGQELHSFHANFYYGNFQGEVRGQREEGEMFLVDMEVQNRNFQRRMRIPDQAVISGPMMEAGLRNLRPGRQLRMRALDPLSPSGELMDIVFTGEGPDDIRVGGEPVRANRVSMSFRDMELHAWLDDSGRVLRQETPFGLILEAASNHDAIRVPSENAVSPSALLSTPFPTSLPDL